MAFGRAHSPFSDYDGKINQKPTLADNEIKTCRTQTLLLRRILQCRQYGHDALDKPMAKTEN